jgi:hypothetical protein
LNLRDGLVQFEGTPAKRSGRAVPANFAGADSRECVMMFTDEMPWLGGEELELVMGRPLSDRVGWKLLD